MKLLLIAIICCAYGLTFYRMSIERKLDELEDDSAYDALKAWYDKLSIVEALLNLAMVLVVLYLLP